MLSSVPSAGGFLRMIPFPRCPEAHVVTRHGEPAQARPKPTSAQMVMVNQPCCLTSFCVDTKNRVRTQVTNYSSILTTIRTVLLGWSYLLKW